MDYERPQFFRLTRYAERADRDVVDMVSGDPDWEPPAALREGLREYADADPDRLQYAPSAGLDELRELIARRRGVAPGQVVVTNGAGEANHLAMAGALSRGSEFLFTDPVYPYYVGRANMLGADHRLVPVDEAGYPDLAAICEALGDDTAAVVVNSPNNPLGVTYDREQVAALVAAAEAHDALLVVDEAYRRFDYSGRFASALSVDSPNRVVTATFSKSLAVTGFRVGYAVFPDPEGPAGDLVEAARTRHMLTNVSGSRPAQAAVLRALRETGEEYHAGVRERLRERVEVFTEGLAAAGAEYTTPEGGFYVTARFPDFPGTFENARRLVDEAGVAGMPGAAFGAARDDWLRFSLTTDRVGAAADRLAAFF